MASLGPIKYLTIHCAATPEGRDNSAAEVTRWDIERFNQPSYHFVIELDGDLVPTLPLTTRGAHTGGHNTGNVGICYVGGTTSLSSGGKPKDTRTAAQRKTLAAFVRKMRKDYPGIIVRGHNEWPGVAKACPSFSVAKWIAAGMPE